MFVTNHVQTYRESFEKLKNMINILLSNHVIIFWNKLLVQVSALHLLK